MTDIASSGRFLRRREDVPVLILSQDYELFFQVSGSIEKCLVDPCDMLLEFANKNQLQITFYVDAGMLCCMQRLSAKNAGIGRHPEVGETAELVAMYWTALKPLV